MGSTYFFCCGGGAGGDVDDGSANIYLSALLWTIGKRVLRYVCDISGTATIKRWRGHASGVMALRNARCSSGSQVQRVKDWGCTYKSVVVSGLAENEAN